MAISTTASSPVRFVLKDDLKHPAYHWPLSRVRYPVSFDAGVKAEELCLVDEGSGQCVPFQLTEVQEREGLVRRAVVNLMSDLPSGGRREFRLDIKSGAATRPAGSDPCVGTPMALVDPVRVLRDPNGIVLDNGHVRVRIAGRGQTYGRPVDPSEAPAPVIRFGDDRGWYGRGQWAVEGQVLKVEVQEVSAGPLVAEFRITYSFDGDRRYSVVVRLTAQMEFVELDEEMSGFTKEQQASWRMIWDGAELEYRYCPNRPDRPIDRDGREYKNYAWERIDHIGGNPQADRHPDRPYDQQFGPEGRLPMKIAPYHNWMSWWRLPTAAFWSEPLDLTLGVFITQMEKWDDGSYAIWGSKDDLCVHFHYNEKVLSWRMTLCGKTRSIAFAAYRHQKDVERVNKSDAPLFYIDDLRRWHGWIPLDKVKDWVLDFDPAVQSYPRFFEPGTMERPHTVKEMERLVVQSSMVANLATGMERSRGPDPVRGREYYSTWTPAFDLCAAQMTPDQRRHIQAAYAFVAYWNMDEAFMPMRQMLAGHPNFLADCKGSIALTAFLFPHHPRARDMADHFEKFCELNLRYHTRPDVPAWEARGGRWTENYGCYVFAAVQPTLRGSFLLHHHFDGRNPIAKPNISLLAQWLMNGLSAPLAKAGGKRVRPPQGAHSHPAPMPYLLRVLGQELMYYDPMTAEHLLWATSATDRGFESRGQKDPWEKMLRGWEDNRGTNPHLASDKFTGYGYVLRAAGGTDQETSVYLQQIDEGPNYRWGRAGRGGNGIIYYYAAGQDYSQNGSEDVGDAPRGDVERCTNFGVKKEGGYRCLGPYRCVGRNELTEPLYDFSFAQFAQVNGGPEALPEYRSRSVLMADAQYIVIYDDVRDGDVEGRLSWFVGRDEQFPHIQQLKPGISAEEAKQDNGVSSYHKDPPELPTKGRYYDGRGSFLTLVTHRGDVTAQATTYGCEVHRPGGKDLVFRGGETVEFSADGVSFRGTAGIARIDGGDCRAALFAGNRIGIPGFTLDVAAGRVGVAIAKSGEDFEGIFQTREGARLLLSGLADPQGCTLYLNGEPARLRPSFGGQEVELKPGRWQWQWTRGAVRPIAPRITRHGRPRWGLHRHLATGSRCLLV